MKSPLITLLAAALLLTGCASQNKEQLAQVRTSGVSATLIHKLERWGCLTLEDILELKRHHVNDAVTLRQLDRAGVDFIVDKDSLRKLRKAGVSESVITAATNASKRLDEQFHHHYIGAWGYPLRPFLLRPRLAASPPLSRPGSFRRPASRTWSPASAPASLNGGAEETTGQAWGNPAGAVKKSAPGRPMPRASP